MTAAGARRRFRLASPAGALILGVLLLALMIAEVPLASLAHQSLAASGGSLPVWISAPFAAVGFVVAWRKPGNPLGWIIMGVAGFFALSEDASYYTVADYRLHHGGLPLGWVALLVQPSGLLSLILGRHRGSGPDRDGDHGGSQRRNDAPFSLHRIPPRTTLMTRRARTDM